MTNLIEGIPVPREFSLPPRKSTWDNGGGKIVDDGVKSAYDYYTNHLAHLACQLQTPIFVDRPSLEVIQSDPKKYITLFCDTMSVKLDGSVQDKDLETLRRETILATKKQFDETGIVFVAVRGRTAEKRKEGIEQFCDESKLFDIPWVSPPRYFTHEATEEVLKAARFHPDHINEMLSPDLKAFREIDIMRPFIRMNVYGHESLREHAPQGVLYRLMNEKSIAGIVMRGKGGTSDDMRNLIANITSYTMEREEKLTEWDKVLSMYGGEYT